MIKSHLLCQLSYRGGDCGRDSSYVDHSVQRSTTEFEGSFGNFSPRAGTDRTPCEHGSWPSRLTLVGRWFGVGFLAASRIDHRQ